MTRLQRETNPTPGFSPGVLPQHQKVDGAFAVTGENNPLPVVNYKSAEVIHSYTGHTGHANFLWQYFGASVTTSVTNLNPLDVTRYKRKLIIIKNGYDVVLQNVRLYATYTTQSGVNGDEVSIFTLDFDDIPPGEQLIITSFEHPELERVPIIGLVVRTNRAGDVTEGTMDVIFIGGV